jgi:imidazolonepropionase-like amidohydrolase
MIRVLLLAALCADPPAHALRNVRLVDRVDAPEVTLILRGGRIEATLDARSEVPPGVRVIDGKGWLALPAFIDAYTQAGCRTPEPQPDQDDAPPPTSDVMVDMRDANRKGLQPGFRCADAVEIDEKTGKGYREQGFGSFLSAPAGQVLSGASVLVTTRDAARRDIVLAPAVFQHAAFRASGPGYPSTLMGYTAQLRQVLLDARHQELLSQRRDAGSPSPRPPYDPGLEALLPMLHGEQRVLCEAETARDIERWIALADEFGISIAIAGGREAWKLAGLLAERRIPVFLTLEWEDEVADPEPEKPAVEEPDTERPDVDEPSQPETGEAAEDPWRYEEPRGVRLERRRRWEEGRDCMLRLIDSGVEI